VHEVDLRAVNKIPTKGAFSVRERHKSGSKLGRTAVFGHFLVVHWWTFQTLRFKKPKAKLQLVADLLDREPPDARETVALLASDTNPDVRRAAILALGKIDGSASLQILTSALGDAKPDVRAAAAAALAQVRDVQAEASLVKALEDSDATVRRNAAHALEGLRWKPADDHQTMVYAIATGKYADAAAIGAGALQPLLAALKNPNSPNRCEILEVLGRSENPEVAKTLVESLKDGDQMVRLKSAEALGGFKDEHAFDPLMRTLGDDFGGARAAAVGALAKIGDHRCFEKVAALLNDREWEARKAAVKAVGRLGGDQAVELLMRMLTDRDHDVREAAIDTLGRLGSPRTVKGLVVALADAHESVRKAAEKTLQKLDPHWALSEAARKAVPELERIQKSRDYWVRQAAIKVLEKIKSDTTAEPQPYSSTEVAQKRDRATVGTLLEMLGDRDRDLRLAAVEALARIGGEMVSKSLAALVKDSDRWVRMAASHAVARRGLQSAGA
jgi:HEAT repeat protein